MKYVPNAVELLPAEFYPDVIAAGGVASALERVAAQRGLVIGAVEAAAQDGRLYHAQIEAALPGRANFTVTAFKIRRLFSVENHESGVAHAWGRTSDLAEVAKAAAAWFAGADPRGMKAAAPFIELPLVAEARATGVAHLVAEANWQLHREAWSGRLRELKPDGWREPTTHAVLRALLDAASAEPRLRHLYAVTSHYTLWFSRCTDYPFVRVGAAIEPLSDGRYRVSRHGGESEFFSTPQAAAARAAELLPLSCGPAIIGTAADVPA
ncbi:DUF6193 family natural product biosynthesis protein [Nocardia sp. NPDC052316]|uniref:DUF6193 family natural product biosynthesis protein n=1 Tax=Nocardia sp. NPDC052316 TaxID=3364329 RepID=UPI0037C8925A